MVLNYDLTNQNYVDFIAELRDEVRDKDQFSHGRPILPLEADANPAFVDVNLLKSDVGKGMVRIRRYDLRLVHYQDPLGNVIDVDHFKLYDDESKLVKSGLEGLLIGLSLFMQAVDSLSNSSKENVDAGTSFLVVSDTKKSTSSQITSDVRTCLAVLCIVLCEGAKLELLSCWLNNAFKSKSQVHLSSWLFQRIHDWEFFSKELLVMGPHSEAADCNFFLPDSTNDWNDGRRKIGVTCQDVARVLGIFRAVPPLPDPIEEEFLSGCTLAEIYSVSVFFNNGRSGSVYGTIKVSNANDIFYIYSRDHTNCEFIESHGTLSLQDPHGTIVVGYKLGLELDLMEGGGGNLEVKDQVLWDGCVRNERYDSRLSAFVKGNNGYAVVYYTVFEEAIQAVVEATLFSKEGHPNSSDAVCVCGKLSARYRDLVYAADFHFKYYQTMLFDKPLNKEPSTLPCTSECRCGGERVTPGENIKLSRTCVAVHVEDGLIITADLKSCEGAPIVTGSMEFLPRELGDFEGTMKGHFNDSHTLQVKVKWKKFSSDLKFRRYLWGDY